MLQGIQTQIRKTRRVRVAVDPEDATLFVKLVQHYFGQGRFLFQVLLVCTLRLLRIAIAFNPQRVSLFRIRERFRYHVRTKWRGLQPVSARRHLESAEDESMKKPLALVFLLSSIVIVDAAVVSRSSPVLVTEVNVARTAAAIYS